MKFKISHRLGDAYIENAWKQAKTEEIEDLATVILKKAQEVQNIEDDLFCILYLAFRCGFRTGVSSIRMCIVNDTLE